MNNILRYAVPALLLAVAQPSFAHVDYVDLGDPEIAPGTGGASFSNFGWYNGTTTALGDSHSLAGGVYFQFHLNQAALVSITFTDNSGSGALNPAFSVYQGLFAAEAHDDTTVDPLNPSHLVASPPPPHNVYEASPVDNGVTTDPLTGFVSPFRDTANNLYNGQFDALHSWSMANNSGEWHVVQYVTHAGTIIDASNPGQPIPTSVSLIDYLLQPGDYTIAAAGAIVYNPTYAVDGLDGTISISSSPVPVPAAAWLFASAMGGFGFLRRRKGK